MGSLVVAPRYKLILQSPAGQWYFPRAHWPDSGVLMFPATASTLPGTTTTYWTTNPLQDAPVYMVVADLKLWRAARFRWRSPAWQVAAAPRARELAPALRAFADEPPDTLLRVLARNAFFDYSLTTLHKIGDMYKMSIPTGEPLFAAMFHLIQKVLDLSDDATLTICRTRLATGDFMTMWCEEIEELDEAVELLDRADHCKITEQKASLRAAKEHHGYIRGAYVKKAVELNEARTKDQPKVAKQTRGNRGGAARRDAVLRDLPDWPERDVELSRVRAMCPEGGSIWASHRFENWQCHFPPFARKSRAWKKYGYKQALNECLRELWLRWAEVNGKSIRDVPIRNLFPSDSSGAAPRSSASSSSRP